MNHNDPITIWLLKIITSISNWSREMKVYRNRISSKIKTMKRSSKCGLAADQQIKLSIMGILVLMAVQCVGATGTNINSFIVISSYASLKASSSSSTNPKREKKFQTKKNFLEVIVKTCEFLVVMNSFVSLRNAFMLWIVLDAKFQRIFVRIIITARY